jgi:hypothetical protein
VLEGISRYACVVHKVLQQKPFAWMPEVPCLVSAPFDSICTLLYAVDTFENQHQKQALPAELLILPLRPTTT